MGESNGLTVTCYPAVAGSKNGSKPVNRVVITDSAGNEYEYQVPPWMKDLPREHIREKALEWYHQELETDAEIQKQYTHLGTQCSTKFA